MADTEIPKSVNEDDRDELNDDALETANGGGGAVMPHAPPPVGPG